MSGANRKQIVVVGAGIAGLSAALKAVELGAHVTIVSKQPSIRSQSVLAESGISAVDLSAGSKDSFESHCNDTVSSAAGLVQRDVAMAMVEAGPGIVDELESLGVCFTKSKGKLARRKMGGHSVARTAFADTETGRQILIVLTDVLRRYEAQGQVDVLSSHDFVTLLLDGTTCTGCAVFDLRNQKIVEIAADAVIMATGGIQAMFSSNTGTLSNAGDATAELFTLGVPMANLEFFQFHPSTAKYGGHRILISEAVRSEGGQIVIENKGARGCLGTDFYPIIGNLATRDRTAREIWRCGQTSTVYIDATRIDPKIIDDRLAGVDRKCKKLLGIDMRKDLIPVREGAHYSMGGIMVDAEHRTGFSNLLAAGECACQYHGANRLGGNSLLGAIYGGKVAAATAVEEGNGMQFNGDMSKHSPDMTTIAEMRTLRETMDYSMGVVRIAERMVESLEVLKDIPGNSSLLAQAAVSCALARKESRGAHYRDDYPESDPQFKKTTVARYVDGETIVEFCEVGTSAREVMQDA